MYKNGTLMIGSSKPIKFSMITDHPLAINYSIDELDSKRNSKIKLNGNQSQESEKLQTIHSRENDSLVTTNWDGLDPLSAEIPSDALTIDLDEKETLSFFETKKNQCYIDNDFENWSWYRLKILRKFNTDEKLSIRSSFVFQNPTMNETSIQPKINRYNRVEQTDESEDPIINEMLGLSQSEYIKQIDDMSNALKNAWNSDQRVKSLKIAIQCAKQLSSVNVLQFYPSKFVLIADILDHFGQLVYERIKQKEKNENDADETCRNWFYKISSIRELLPRFYIECSVLKIYDFLLKSDNHPNNFEPIILRLTRMIRGIGDPLVAIYCRVYLCRITIQIAPECKKIFLQNFHEIFDGLNQMTSSFIQELLLHQKLSYPSYYKLFIPALNWILNCLFYKNAIYEDILLYFVSRSSKLCDRSTSAFILSSMINRFSSRFIAQNLIKIFNLIQDLYIDSEDHTKSYPRYILIKNIGQSLLKEEDFFQKYLIDKDEVFAKFSAITKLLRSKSEYITCIEIWSEIYAKFNDVNSINNFLGDIIENLSCDYENFGSQLLNILTKIIIHGRKSSDHDAFYSMNNLMPFLDLFQRDDYKLKLVKQSLLRLIATVQKILQNHLI
ncbi:hypothetical protein SSS_07599 [Sarcoptes scabiei]|nr:hypothetical protein SSS_07599 [Sarcoptes scabiei]